MTTFDELLALGERLDDVLDDVAPLAKDMRPHAVYSGEHVATALTSLTHARTGLAQSIGYAALEEERSKRSKPSLPGGCVRP